MGDIMTCSLCHTELTAYNQHSIDNEYLCINCYEDNTDSCSCCGERIWNDDNAGSRDTPLCESCYDQHYTTCSRCGFIITHDEVCNCEDNDDPYCHDCYVSYEKCNYIHSYNYKPSPIFYGEDIRFFGVEIEIDNGGKSQDNAESLVNIANAVNDHVYIKSDSSLDDGLEIVTHPMSLKYHINSMPWSQVLKHSIGLGYRSHETSTCGLHIHVNRSCFTDNFAYQEECIARVLYLVERFWEELLRFSRRTQSQLKRWANRYGYKERPEDILDSAKRDYGGRYTCVNLTNRNTIEFRIFRGTLKYNTFIATLQLVNEICDVAFSISDEEIRDLSWCGFMERISHEQYPELVQYLKERRLYINEPITCEAEV